MDQLTINIIGAIVGVLSLCASGGALLVSLRANKIAERAPIRARTRAHRDQVRDALRSTLEPLRKAQNDLRDGADLSSIPDTISNARSVLDDTGRKLPEFNRLVIIQSNIGSLQGEWAEILHAQESVETFRKWHLEWQPRVAEMAALGNEKMTAGTRRIAEDYDERREQAARKRDAVRPRLSERIDRTLKAINAYLAWIDSHDRRGTDPDASVSPPPAARD